MFDIHCHIIPNVDDGSGNMNDSIEMAQLAADSGVKALAATPHCNVPGMFDNFWSAELENKLALLLTVTYLLWLTLSVTVLWLKIPMP